MKDIKTKINEGWEFTSHLSDTMGEELDIPKSAKWLLINTEGEMISAVTAKDLNSFISDFDAKILLLKHFKQMEQIKMDFSCMLVELDRMKNLHLMLVKKHYC